MIREKLKQLTKSQKFGAELAEELAKIIAARAKESPTKIPAEITAINQFILQHLELTELENSTHQHKNNTLLYKLVAGVPNAYSIEIINHLIAQCRDLSGRRDLLSVMILDRTISHDPDMSQTFDLLVERGLPQPTPEQIKTLMSDSRLRQGFNATNLAKSFLNKRQDPSLIRQIIDAPKTRNNAEEKQSLEIFLTRGTLTEGFQSHAANLVRVNSDSVLKSFLRGRRVSELLQESADHSEALNLAAAHKYIETFKILIEAGFDPLKHPENEPNCIALACESQGKSTLGNYLSVIKAKYGQDFLEEILNEGKSALTHAIEVRAYIGTIKLLLENGARIETNYLENLKTLVRKGDAGAFEFLLKRESLDQQGIDELSAAVKDEANFVVADVFLNYLRKEKQTLPEDLLNKMSEKQAKLKEEDLFQICQLSGEKTFLAYMAGRDRSWLNSHINSQDAYKKTPLYYAIADNAYNGLVTILLHEGANLNFIAFEEDGQTELNAATLAIRNSESETLKIILKSQHLLPESILAAAQELAKPENNEAILTTAFIGSLDLENLASLNLEIRQTLLQRTLELKQPELVTKIANTSKNGDLTPFVKTLLSNAIENADVDLVKIIAENDKVRNLLSEIVELSEVDLDFSEIDERKSESTPLLSASKKYGTAESPNVAPSSLSAEKLNAQLKFGEKFTDQAFEIATSNSEKSQNAKAIFKILIEAGFDTSKNEREIKALKIDGEGRSAWCPRLDECCVIS